MLTFCFVRGLGLGVLIRSCVVVNERQNVTVQMKMLVWSMNTTFARSNEPETGCSGGCWGHQNALQRSIGRRHRAVCDTLYPAPYVVFAQSLSSRERWVWRGCGSFSLHADEGIINATLEFTPISMHNTQFFDAFLDQNFNRDPGWQSCRCRCFYLDNAICQGIIWSCKSPYRRRS